MFNSKKEKLFDNDRRTSAFVKEGVKKSVVTRSGNDSLKYTSSGSEFVDQFATASRYLAPRSYSEISIDMIKLWSVDPLLTVKFTLYLRTISRVAVHNGVKTETTQRGQGLKHESIMRMIWLYNNHEDTFWHNIKLFISLGSWKDIIQMLQYDLIYHGWEDKVLNWNKMTSIIIAGLENPDSSELIKKYLPQIKAKSKCTTVESQADTLIGKWLCSKLFSFETSGKAYKLYRKFKSSGNAHTWQKLISQHRMLDIDFNTIHGRALAQLVSGKFLKNQGLEEKYTQWISNQPVAKFTGFVHELVSGINPGTKKYKLLTIDAQYNGLLEKIKFNLQNSTFKPIAVLDSSGSMDCKMYIGSGEVGNISSIEVAMANLILFDDMIEGGYFKGHYLSFSTRCHMHKIHGKTFTEKYLSTPRMGQGGTNFMSIFDLFIDLKINKNVHEKEFPNMIVCFSDGEFNSVGKNITNVEAGRKALVNAGFSKEFADNFGFCFVDMPNTFYSHYPEPKFETYGNVKNCFYFSGYDLSPLSFLFGYEPTNKELVKNPATAEELFEAAMDQEILNKVTLS